MPASPAWEQFCLSFNKMGIATQSPTPVAYASQSLTAAERNYGITELETLAVVWALTHFHSYLYGQEVTVFTDHSAVKSILNAPNPSGKHAHWWTKVYGSSIRYLKILHRSGKSNLCADALSHSPVGSAPEEGFGEAKLQVAVVSSSSAQCDPPVLLNAEQLASRKCQGPSTCLVFIGIEFDTMSMELRLPEEKLGCLQALITSWRGRKSCQRKELESLVGHLHHACKVVCPGRRFLRDLLALLS